MIQRLLIFVMGGVVGIAVRDVLVCLLSDWAKAPRDLCCRCVFKGKGPDKEVTR